MKSRRREREESISKELKNVIFKITGIATWR